MPNPWDNDPIIAPAGGVVPPPMPMTRPLTAPQPKPVEPRRPNTTTVEGTVLNISDDGRSVTPIYTAPPKPGEKPLVDPVLKGALDGLGLDELMLAVQRSRSNIQGGWATGIKGAAGGMVPGSDRNDFLGNLDSLKGGITMEKLAALKAASATGASGMGALSEKEGERLASSVSSLRDDMSPEELLMSMQVIERHVRVLKAISKGMNPEDPAVAAQFGIPDMPTVGGTVPPPGGRPDTSVFNKAMNDIVGDRRQSPEQRLQAAIAYANQSGRNVDPEQVKAAIAAGRGNVIEGPSAEPPTPRASPTAPEAANGLSRALSLGVGDLVQATGDAFGLIANPLNAGINALTGLNLGTDLGRSARDASGAPLPVTDSERFASGVNRGGVGALTLGGAAGAGSRLVGALARGPAGQVVGNALSRFAPTPVRDAIAGSVAGGASDLTRQAGGGPVAQAAVGLLAGGTTAALATPGVARSLMGRTAPTANTRPVIQAAVDEGVELPKIMVSGSRKDAIKAGMFEADGSTAVYAQNAFEGVNDQLSSRASALGQGGTARGRADVGEATRAAASRIRDADRQGYRSAYQAAEQVDGDPLVDLASMRTRLDRDIARLSTVPGGDDTVRELQRLRKGIEQPIPLSSVREMRTNLREGIDIADMTRSSALKRADARALAAVEGANKDIEGALSPAGLEAWRAADKQFAQAQTTIREALRPFVGKDFDQLPAEAIFDRLKNAANGNGRSLAELHRRLPPRLSRDIAATFAEGMGKAAGDSGEPFSAVRFISDARKFSPSARQTLFGPSGATSIDNMLRISRRMRDVQSEINRSKTARPVRQKVGQMMNSIITMASGAGGALVTGGIGGATIGAGVGIAITAGVAQLQAMSARTLMNPRTTRWLESLLDVKSPGEARQAAARLAVIMDREPTIANDLQPYHDVLTREMTAPVAASEPDGEHRDR